ncbi:hypothetical protein [Shewanella polaris]|uniref:hypothetical protein n=1 Tax=Shewanella polaris TaxID=2588449 RepID=UPI00142F0875|nr:hypothetical protein [Shewanella polaris]
MKQLITPNTAYLNNIIFSVMVNIAAHLLQVGHCNEEQNNYRHKAYSLGDTQF